jgi:metallopeptidase MepB
VREDLFQLINAVFKRKETLDPESQLYLDLVHGEFLRNGLGIQGSSERRCFGEAKKELQELKVAYLKSLNRSTGIWVTIRELDGFPRDSLESLKTGDGENASRVWLPFMKPHIEYALRFVQSEATRLKVFVGYDNRCLDNVPRLKKTIILRNEAARLLGYVRFRVESPHPYIARNFAKSKFLPPAPGGIAYRDVLVK